MADRTVTVTIRANVGSFIAGMAGASKSVSDLAARTAAGVQGIDRGLAKSGASVTGFTKSLGKNEQAVRSLSTTSAGLGLAIGAAVGLAVKSFADFDKQMSAVAATGSDAKDNLQALRDTAVKAGADTAFSAGEAAQGIENLLKAGVSAKDVIGGGLTGALNLAAAGSVSVGDAAETAATAMTQFGLSGRDVPHIADLIAAGAGKAQGDVSDLALALKQSGLVASQFGLSIEDTTGTLAAFASAGLIGSDAGTSFKTMLLSLANPAAKTKKEMTELGISAYDAQGNFVGITDLAEQLKTKLGPLNQATRDQALAQIFGNDAIRAANVLYDQGGAGITDWINKTNDAGYAAGVAATKMDNLSGDLEYLRGSLDSAFIKSGSGANAALRSLVQGANQLVNAIGDLPAPVLESGLKVAAFGAAGLLAVAGVGKLVVGVAALRTSLLTLAPAGSLAATRLSAVGVAAGGAIGVLAVAASAQILVEKFKPAAATLDQTTAALTRAGNGSVSAKGDLDALFQSSNGFDTFANGVKGITPEVNNLGTALDYVANADWFEKVKGSAGDLPAVQKQIENLDAALAKMDPTNAQAAFDQIRASIDPAKVSIDQLLAQFPQYKAALEAQAVELGNVQLSAQEYADWMGGKVPAAIRAAQQSQHGYRAATDKTKAETDKATAALDKQAKALGAQVVAMFASANAAIGLSDAHIGFEQAIDDATAAAKKNGRAISDNTAKGRANNAALNSLAGAGLRYAQQLGEQHKSTNAVTAATQRARDRFITTARAMGYTKEAAGRLANQYGLIPKKVATAVAAPGATNAKADTIRLHAAYNALPGSKQTKVASPGARPSKKDVDAFIRTVRGVPASKLTAIRTVAQLSGVRAAKAALASVRDKRVTIFTSYTGGKAVAGFRGGIQASAGATGGYVTGPGSATSDDIPAWLSNGEYIIRAAAVRAVGLSRLHELNAKGYAGGGPVTINNRHYVDTTDRRSSRHYVPGYAQGGPVRTTAPQTVGVDTAGIAGAVYAGLRGAVFTLDGRLIDVKVSRGISAVIARAEVGY